ncbi:hypothetical protein, partial [Adlercreutzia sp. ZJ473]|uniref:hypothetical protein n=1 Tax=Adlercreutzia sp. ZJ473 TaxID=2722822 RepID=UPI001C12D475
LGLSKLLVGKLLEDSTYGMESSKRIPIGLLELYDHAVVLTLTSYPQVFLPTLIWAIVVVAFVLDTKFTLCRPDPYPSAGDASEGVQVRASTRKYVQVRAKYAGELSPTELRALDFSPRAALPRTSGSRNTNIRHAFIRFIRFIRPIHPVFAKIGRIEKGEG